MALVTNLSMSFLTEAGKRFSLSVADPKDDLTEADIKSVMDMIIAKNIFSPDGTDLKIAEEAKIVVTDTTEYDLV